VRNDSSLAELADLPLGWYAERSKVGHPWVRRMRGRVAGIELLFHFTKSHVFTVLPTASQINWMEPNGAK